MQITPRFLGSVLALVALISASASLGMTDEPPHYYELTPEQRAEIARELGDDAQKGLSSSVEDLMHQLALDEYVREVQEAEAARLATTEINPYTEDQPPVRIFGLDVGTPHEHPEHEPSLYEKTHDLGSLEVLLKKYWFF